MKRSICAVLLLVIAALSSGGCVKAENGKSAPVLQGSSTNNANVQMGGGHFAYGNGYIYASYLGKIFEYDIANDSTATLEIDGDWPFNLYVDNTHIYYFDATSGMTKKLSKDGQTKESIAECELFYAEGDYAYYTLPEGLYQLNTVTNDSRLLTNMPVSAFYPTENDLYMITPVESHLTLMHSSLESISFEPINLSFEPISIYIYADDLYLSTIMQKRDHYQIVRYRNGQEEWLPIYSTNFHIIDNTIIFEDSTSRNNSCTTLKTYALDSGEQTVLVENVFKYATLVDRYICCICRNPEDGSNRFIMYDWKTKETKQMYPLEQGD